MYDILTFSRLRIVLLISQLLWPFPAIADLTLLKTNTNLHGVYLFEDNNTSVYRLQFVFIAGEADISGPEGVSHYLEHLMYAHANRIGDNKFHGRTANATANGVNTIYFVNGQRSELDNMFSFGKNLLTPPDLDVKFMRDERKVVLREYDLKIGDYPDRRSTNETWRLLMGENTAGRSAIGTPASIMSLSVEGALKYHQQFYHPANMVLLISGPISAKNAVERVNNTFAGLPSGLSNPQSWRQKPGAAPFDSRRYVRDRNVRSKAVIYHSLADWTLGGSKIDDYYTSKFVEALFSSSLEGGLSRPLKTDQFVVSSFRSRVLIPLDGHVVFWFQGSLDEGITSDIAIASIRAALADIAVSGISEKSLERIRRRILKKESRLRDEQKHAFNRAVNSLMLGFEPNSYEDHVRRINAVSKANIDSLLKAIGSASRTISTSLDKGTGQ